MGAGGESETHTPTHSLSLSLSLRTGTFLREFDSTHVGQICNNTTSRDERLQVECFSKWSENNSVGISSYFGNVFVSNPQ